MPLLTAERVREVLRRGDRSRMDVDLPPKFKPGDRVRTRNIHPLGHTRLPRYARGHLGVVERDHGVFVFADASGRGLGKIPQHVYAVRFTARELWGADASPRDAIYVDLCDDHLDPT
jgi:nitrile hydratase